MHERQFNLWALVRPAKDVPGQWVAHCLDLDVVSQGNDFKHALQMLSEAVFMLVADDLHHGRDVFERSRAPEEDWEELGRVTRDGTFTDLSAVPVASGSVVAAVQLHVNLHATTNHVPSDVAPLPPAWMIAAPSSAVPGQLAPA